MRKVNIVFKKFIKTGITACALAACTFALPVVTEAATMDDYQNLRGVSVLSKMDLVDQSEIRRTAPELKEIGDWYRRVAFYLGDKDYAVITGWAPQKIQLVTPYSLTKYITYLANEDLVAPDKALIDEIAKFKDVCWVWVWSNGSYNVLNTDAQPPVVTNVVVRTPDNTFNYHLEKDQYMPVNALAKAKLNQAQLWPFPAKLFSLRNIPLEIIVVDDKGNKKPLKLRNDDLTKCK